MTKLRLEIVRSPIEPPWREVVLEPPGEYIIGRDPRTHIPVLDRYASRRHARIYYKNGKWYIEDLGSRNGTLIGDKDIRGMGPVELPVDAELVIGVTVIKVKVVE